LEQFKEYIFSIQDDVNDQEQEETSIDNNEMVNKTKEDCEFTININYKIINHVPISINNY